jgi:hypothetical protein
MNCHEFRKNADGLARGALLDARVREEAAAHEAECANCAASLANERALTAGLRALAATTSGREAPARAESTLLSAFRARAASDAQAAPAASSHAPSTAHAPSNPSNVFALAEHAGAKQWSWVRSVAVAATAAAAALALFMLVPPMTTPVPGGSDERAAGKNNGATTSRTNGGRGAGKETANGVEDKTAGRVEEEDSSSGGVDVRASNPDGVDGRQRAIAPRRAPVRATPVNYERGSNTGTRGGAAVETASAEEVTTDFFPLMQGAAYAQSESTHLVRVELPRSALVSFGMAVNPEQAGGRVKADVLLGEDGTARAIRFVR